MKYFITALTLALFISCSSDDDTQTIVDYSAENEEEILAYIAQHNLDATRTDSGLYYVVNGLGTGERPTSTSDVSVRYVGTFTDGTEFDNSNGEIISFNLQNVILGFAEGMQLFNEGGSGMLLVPAHLAYGGSGSVNIPPGAVLIFEFELVDYEVENNLEIIEYLESNQIASAVKTDSGLYYLIEEEGQGNHPTINSNVTVVYKAYLTDNIVFEESDDEGITTDLNKVISGWAEGIQYFKEGGSGKLFIPSHLGYGIYDYANIPGGSVLIFDVELVSIN